MACSYHNLGIVVHCCLGTGRCKVQLFKTFDAAD